MAEHLSKEQASKLVKNYQATIKKGGVSKDKNGNDIHDQTKWVWFPKAQMEQVLKSFESSGIPEDEQGIKFYMGVYDTDPVRGPEDMGPYVGLLTLLMVPSFKDEKGEVIDLATLPANGGSVNGDDDSGADNAGTMCPPNCPVEGGDELP